MPKIWEHDCIGNVWLDGYGRQEHCFGDAERGLCVSIDCSSFRHVYDDDTTFIIVEKCPFCGKTAEQTKGQIAAAPRQARIACIPGK
ncbi:MAG: hypothetical protein Q7R92_05495 [bacterium]|nr:hypothetical protein [bacterium]